MWKLFVFLTILQISSSFNVDSWVKRYCVTNKNVEFPIKSTSNFYCENVAFTKQELEDIQKGGFVISNNKRIIFNGGDIGIVNKKFLKKFSRCEELVLYNVKMKFDTTNDRVTHPLQTFTMHSSTVSGNKDTPFFKSFPNLKEITLFGNKFDYKVLDKETFGVNNKIIKLSIKHNNFEDIKDDTLSGLPNLKELTIGAGLVQLSPQLLSGADKLETLSLSGNKFQEIPCEGLPKGIDNLDLSENKITQLKFEKCKFLKSIRNFDLSENGIEYLNAGIFDPLEYVENIDLSKNKLNYFTKSHVQNLKYLEKIDLSGNRITGTDIKGKISVIL